MTTVNMIELRSALEKFGSETQSRFKLWESFINLQGCQSLLEVGVYKGEFAEHLLQCCPGITVYHMVDPWRHLDDWNKPANKSDEVFNFYYEEARQRTSFAQDRVAIHRGTTLEVVHEVPDSSIDFAYIDGDHTLQGITIDLNQVWPKVRPGGWIAGDDFCTSIWQHSAEYEPTLVFPYAVYFAKAFAAPIFAVGHAQFLIWKNIEAGFCFHDILTTYGSTSLGPHLVRRPMTILERIRTFSRAFRGRILGLRAATT